MNDQVLSLAKYLGAWTAKLTEIYAAFSPRCGTALLISRQVVKPASAEAS